MKIVFKVPDFIRSKEFLLAASTAMATLSGAFLQATLATRRLEEKFRDISEMEIAEAKLYYSHLYKTGEYEDPMVLAESYGREKLQQLIEQQGYVSREPTRTRSEDVDLSDDEVTSAVEEITESTKNIFAEAAEAAEEAAKKAQQSSKNKKRARELARGPEGEELVEIQHPNYKGPYVISQEEFYRNELDFEQVSVEYYMVDDVLVDERSQPVGDADKMVGDSVNHFGFKSGDPNIVYVRNEELEVDFEIKRNTGSYSEEVAGFVEDDEPGRPRREGRTT